VVERPAVGMLRLTIEYDGGGFHGWARQPGQRTVEGALRDALDVIYPGGWDGLAVAGRTDRGVHATGQVASVTVTGGAPAARAAEALNTALPPDVSVLAAEDAPEGFHARFSASARSYRYLVLNRVERSALEAKRSLWWPRPVDLPALEACAALLPGEHDFSAFTPAESQHEVFLRVIREAAWERRGDHLHFTVTADSFLRHMVRTLVGTMLQASPERIAHLLEGRPRSEGGATAPPWGLYLEHVEYGYFPRRLRHGLPPTSIRGK
jgi:tRNA pseudouridine38-40 synthase